jgi:cobalt/nickel transport system permease protein
MMLTERCAYSNRWRTVSVDAKAAFAALGLVAAFVARPPAGSLAVAVVLAAATVLGAGVSARSYARVAMTPWAFLLVSAVTLAVSVRLGGDGPLPLSLAVDPGQAATAVGVVSRSVAALSATLFLALTTPMTDVISLARRLRVPATLIEMMTICYRALFVLSDAVNDTRQAQSARLGYSSWSNSMRSMGSAVAQLAVESWRRSIVMHQASVARAGGEELRFLELRRDGASGQIAVALSCGVALVVAAAVVPGAVG